MKRKFVKRSIFFGMYNLLKKKKNGNRFTETKEEPQDIVTFTFYLTSTEISHKWGYRDGLAGKQSEVNMKTRVQIPKPTFTETKNGDMCTEQQHPNGQRQKDHWGCKVAAMLYTQ